MGAVNTAITGPVRVLLAVPVGRNSWVSKEVLFHYEASRLIKTEGIELAKIGPMGVTGTLYVVKESFFRDNRLVKRIERQTITNGQVVSMQNWGEIEDTVPGAA
jgi:hypothetical protein